MAAPGSPYSRVMCEPAVTLLNDTMSQVPVPPVAMIAAGLSAVLALLVGWRRPRSATRNRLAMGLVGVLLAPMVVVLFGQVALPRDCFSGRTDAGECGRDRELR